MTDPTLDKNAPLTETSTAPHTDSAQDNDHEIVTPDILNLDYRYVRLLGEGANGRTWLAKDRKTALDVAIKELKFADNFKAYDLFEREAEVLQSVSIDGVPRFYRNYNRLGMNYIVQEYIPYPSLESLLEKGKIFTEEEVYTILDLTSEIIFALQTQYIPPIIHRDIKPGNILYRAPEAGHDAKVWLIDFGAVANPQKQSSASTFTFAGTFGYMAPEQLQGEVSIRTDYYALGTTALHLLTGVFPYNIPNELFHLKFHPVIKEKAPHTTQPMIDLLDMLLMPEPQNRPHDVQALRKAIRDAQKASTEYRALIFSDDDNDLAEDQLYLTETPLKRFWHFHVRKNLRKWFVKPVQRQIMAIRKKKLDFINRREKLKREKEEKRLQEMRNDQGIEIKAIARRVSITHQIPPADQSLLEGIFMYEGNWYPVFLTADELGVVFRCITEAPDPEKVELNTFIVKFLPKLIDTTVKLNQEIWLSEDLYTRLTGKSPKRVTPSESDNQSSDDDLFDTLGCYRSINITAHI